eukprot:gene6769-5781_t
MAVDDEGTLGPTASDPVPVSHVERVWGIPVSSHLECPACPDLPTVTPTWDAPHGSRCRPQIHMQLHLHVHDDARGPPVRLARGDGTCQAPTHRSLLSYVAALDLEVDERADSCGRCRLCCVMQPAHPCPGNGLHDVLAPLLHSRRGLEQTLREVAAPLLAMQKDGGTLPASIARFMSDDPVGQAGHRCGCSKDCRCVQTVRKTQTWCHEDGQPPAFAFAVLGRFGGCVQGGRVGQIKNLSRVALSDPQTDAAVTLIRGQSPYAVEVEVLHTEPTLHKGHWVASGRFAHGLHLWDDATEGQSHLYAVLYRRSDVTPPPRRPRALVNPHGYNWCPFHVTLITVAATWHVLEPGLRKHGPVTKALVAVMQLMFDGTAPADAAVGTQPGELGTLTHFTQMFFRMRPAHAPGSQMPMCEVWDWLAEALRSEHNAWRNVAFYRGFTAAEPAGFFFEDLCRPLARGGKAGDYAWLEAHHGWVQWAFPTLSQGQNYHSSPLTPWEADVFRQDPEIRRRGLRACSVLLDFLGLQFTGAEAAQPQSRTGGIRVSRNVGGGWDVREKNWEQHAHNNLRVTRMLEFLLLAGCAAHARAFVAFVTGEIAAGELQWCQGALESHWLSTRVLDDVAVQVDHTGAQYTATVVLPVPAGWAHFTLQGAHPYA